MGLISIFKDFFSSSIQGVHDITTMSRAASVAAQVPLNSDYVTIGMIKIIMNAADVAQPGVLARPLGYIPDSAAPLAGTDTQAVCYLAKVQTDLLVIRDNQTLIQVHISDIERIQNDIHGGFVLVLKDGRGITVSTQTPVEIPSGATFRTVPAITNNRSGWDLELAPFHIPSSM